MDPTTVAFLLVIAVINLKGGTGKTTSAVYVAHVLHALGYRVLLVDADPQASALRWHEDAGFPFPVVSMPSGKLHRDLVGILPPGCNAVVIDTPPRDAREAAGSPVTLSAARAATHVLVPVSPSPMEHRRLSATADLLDEADTLRRDDQPPAVRRVLLVKTITGAASPAVYREAIAADGWTVLQPVVARREAFAMADGDPVVRAEATAYGDVVAALVDVEAVSA